MGEQPPGPNTSWVNDWIYGFGSRGLGQWDMVAVCGRSSACQSGFGMSIALTIAMKNRGVMSGALGGLSSTGTISANGGTALPQAAVPTNLVAPGGTSNAGGAFLVTPSSTVLPPGTDYNLVDSNTSTTNGGDWVQIHGTHAHANQVPHTHFPVRHPGGSVNRETRPTTAADIDRADGLLRSGQMRVRTGRNDRGGP